MAWKVGLPNLGHTMESGTVSEWLMAVGDTVSAGDVIGLVESDKATFDIEAPGEGVVLALYVNAGTEVPVGTTIALVGAPGEEAETDQSSALPAPAPVAQPPEVAQPATEPLRRRVMASPAARRLAEELGVDLGTVTGMGDEGMISKEDVTAAAAATTSGTAMSPMRQAIAEATSKAWATIPHVALTSHADLPDTGGSGSGALTARVVRAAALALQAHPGLNGWLTGNRFERSGRSHIGVVVAVEDGLVPVTVADADRKPVDEITKEIAGLAADARAGTIKGAQTAGASFTVSSLGRWGVDTFSPVISAPQVAILGVGRVRRVAREAVDGGVRFVSELGLTLVFDHRANDGVAAAECLAAIVAHLENPDGLVSNQ